VSAPLRIVSLVPSLTELVCELGLLPSLVGRTGFCIHPREALRAVPKVGGTKDVDLDKVRALAPTHLIVNIDENEKAAVDALARFVPEVIVTHPIEVADNFELYERFGRLFGREARAAELSARLREVIGRVTAQSFAPLPVLYLIWRKPWMTVSTDTYIAKMLRMVGLEAIAPDSGDRYPVVDLAGLDARRAAVVLLSSEPYPFTEEHRRQMCADPAIGVADIRLVDGEMTSWYGSRAIAGLDYLLAYRRGLDDDGVGR
jgi:ABC-type Fe3+-hydroxamate transport system substrate-binding protein